MLDVQLQVLDAGLAGIVWIDEIVRLCVLGVEWLDWGRLRLIVGRRFRSIALRWWGWEAGGSTIAFLKLFSVVEFEFIFRVNVF